MYQASCDRAQSLDGLANSLNLLSIEDLLSLVNGTRGLASEVHLPTLLHHILVEAARLTSSPDGGVILQDETRNCLYFANAIGDDAEFLLDKWGKNSDLGIPLVGSKAGQVFTSGESEIVNAVPNDLNHFRRIDNDTQRETTSMVCVPLIATSRHTGTSRVIGVIQLLNKCDSGYTERDRALLERFADQAAIALENAHLISQLFAHMGLHVTGETDVLTLYRDLQSRMAWRETISVLFADMRGFTQLCQVIGRPEQIQNRLNDFLTMLSEAVISHGGIVNKFLGDGLMALFRTESYSSDAVNCAFSMLSSFDVLKAKWDQQSNLRLNFLDLGIGISTEDVMLGSIGSEEHWDFTAVGNGVNLAAHLMENAREGRRLLVDKVTFLAVEEDLEEYIGPEQFQLQKPGQSVGHPYERYYLIKQRGDNDLVAEASNKSVNATRGALFISYSHQDKSWLRLIQKHLKPYVRSGAVELWDDTEIRAGDQWRTAIRKALDRAQIALLIVSPSFLESDFINNNELPPLLEAARSRGLRVLWLPVTASSYEETVIGEFQAAASPAKPLDSLPESEQNRILVTVCRLIKSVL